MENKGTQRIETDRLILRQFRIEDAEPMYKNWASDPEVTKFLTWPPHKDVDLTRSLIEDWISRYAEPSYYHWIIELKGIGEVIGTISAVKLNEKIEAADVGYCMGKAWWGKGIMPEALRAVIAYFFEEVGLNRVAACHDVNNPKSGRVMQKAGMKQEGILRAAGRNNQGICDEVWCSILRNEFER
ncbi:MAG: GNAT family N-acetyltransferase [Lachnospiraceae bacterium]|nr:GNAT family N-acetyltransferase [Lachnospiraceae bacterium]